MPTLFKRSNGIYYVCYDDRGRRRWRSTKKRTRDEALKSLGEFGDPAAVIHASPTLEAFTKDLLSFLEQTHSPHTVEIYRRALRNLFKITGNSRIEYITIREAEAYRLMRSKVVSPASVNVDLRALRAAFTKAMKWKLLPENPFKEVPMLRIPEKAPIYFTEQDFQKLLGIVKQQWLRDILVVAVLTGMRQGELLSLKWSNLDFERGLIRIQSSDSFTTKSGKRRSIPMHESVRELLVTRRTESQSDLVFTLHGNAIQGNWVQHLLKRNITKAGLNPLLHFHSLRHTFATWLVQRGVSIYEIQKLLGHSNISVTQIYSHLASSELQGAVAKINISLS